ncbi:CSL zinc finger-domain-containing protein [Syncephalis pseudoplumigaleata]|uniref:Diphthamide biosynthesis protein 4 n=1 Tax=Syncephalis pseudoplumigaleata TaxID=1712513 RepID=A0A4P9Z5N1_9FUNG|nr:CSL zinc finger-domain-containing protein [Syncephalis pseudoplumigaleata]|eukprot:RKP27933.1 CSL zinc finger-domain-containing protein [Syncephalis pseudoplumigaleata]
MREPSLYDILGVPEDATRDTIWKTYQRQLLQASVPATFDAKDAGNDTALRAQLEAIRRAWAVLGDPDARSSYDIELKADRLRQSAPMDVAVDLDDMAYDEETGVYSYACRCSGEYQLTEDDLEAGADLINCSQCSLRIRVLYQCVDDAAQA